MIHVHDAHLRMREEQKRNLADTAVMASRRLLLITLLAYPQFLVAKELLVIPNVALRHSTGIYD